MNPLSNIESGGAMLLSDLIALHGEEGVDASGGLWMRLAFLSLDLLQCRIQRNI